jgi:hypothetical protein
MKRGFAAEKNENLQAVVPKAKRLCYNPLYRNSFSGTVLWKAV